MEWTWAQSGALLVQLAMGVGLASCAGLRAFLPLFVVGVAGRLEVVPLSGSFEWLASTPSLVVFGVAVLAELLADKFPLVDNFLDVVQVGVKPIAGTVLVACVVTDLTPLQAVVLGIVLGGPAAAAVLLTKAKLRLLSSATTAGVANPAISVAEDAGAFGGAVAAVLIPVVVVILLAAALIAAWTLLRRSRRVTERGQVST